MQITSCITVFDKYLLKKEVFKLKKKEEFKHLNKEQLRKDLIKKLKGINTLKELEDFVGCRAADMLVSHRGGCLGFTAEQVINAFREFEIDRHYLPTKIGAFCNDLGGMRDVIRVSNYRDGLPKKHAELIEEFTKACRRAYEKLEDEYELNNETFPDGEVNWNAVITKEIRYGGRED